MGLSSISSRYEVRRLGQGDIPEIYELCRKNSLYYEYCPPFVTPESIRADLGALPPGKESTDKYYLGFYDGGRLNAVLDLILAYPDGRTAFIGFFMMEQSMQGTGIGSESIGGLCVGLKDMGFRAVRLGWVQGNPQARQFWQKNGFRETGISYQTENYTVVVAQRELDVPGA